MTWTFAVTVDRVICGPRVEQWHARVRLHTYAFRKPQSALFKYSWNMRLQRAILCRVCRPHFKSLKSISRPTFLGWTRCTSSIGTLFIHTFIKDNMAILDQNFEIMRTGWNVPIGVLFFVQ
jgi:exonuclease I